ncbi:MAG: lamin tail domain-containing protein [Ferruginibacter sp.]
MKSFFTLLLIIISLFSFSQVRISQVYGGGGNPGATYLRDFVEIYNAGTTTVDISNWSIQYASATGPVAPGDWAVTGIPAGNSIDPGKYFLIALASGGAAGVALPTPDFLNNGINISNTAGKIALVTNATALNGTTGCSGGSVIDVIGYGAAATCFETAFAVTTGIDNTMSQFRGSNGCDETNDNSADFSIGTVNPRNSASAANSCIASPALLTAAPGSLNIYSTVGINSNPEFYTLSGLNLTGFPGNLTVTASAGLQVSLNSGSGYAGSINVPYTSATLANTVIYVRIAASAPQGIMNGTVTNSGGGASSPAIVTIGGGVYQDYYNTKADNGLNVTSTWSNTPDGLGFSPADFTTPFQAFNIIDQTNAHYTGVWDVSDAILSPRVIVGDGTTAINFVIPAGQDSMTMATRVNVTNNSTLTILNNRRPFLNNLYTGSTVDFAQSGTSTDDTIRIPNISFYNLKLTGGLKYFSPATTTTRGSFTADAVVGMSGSAPVFSTLNVFGDVNLLNGSHFDPLPTTTRITLAMNGNNGTQTINMPDTDTMYLFRLQRDSTNSNSHIIFSGRNLTLGNAAGGGLRLNQGAVTSTILDFTHPFPAGPELRLTGAAFVTNGSMGKIQMTAGNIDARRTSGSADGGTLRFTNTSTLLTLTTNSIVAGSFISIADSISTEFLNLEEGKIVVKPGATLTVTDGPLLSQGYITGGSATSFVEGKLRQSGLINTYTFPVGRGDKYAPVDINNVITEDMTVEYFFTDFGNHTIDPATLNAFPDYNISYNEYWILTDNGVGPIPTPDINFHYTDTRSGIVDPTQVKIAHFDGTDWDDLGGTADPANTVSNGFVTVTGVSTFSPFTFSARTTGILPVRLTSFTAQKENKTVKLNWSTSQEINSSHFVVQRSGDGRTWKDITSVTAAGNSNTKIDYTTTDNAPLNGINFYRIKEIDMNGKFDYSETRTILFSSKFEISVTPNPAVDFINVYISKENNKPSTIILMDVNGRQLKNYATNESSYKINSNLLTPGVYFIRVVNEGMSVVKKIVVY